MIVHFASVGQEFFYSQYLAVVSGYKVHSVDKAIVWTTEIPLKNPYWKRVGEIAEIKHVDVPYIPGINRFPLVQQRSIQSDWMRWKALYEYGGLYLDLDTLSVRDIIPLLGDKEVCVSVENPNDYSWLGSHTIIAKPKSEVIKHAWDFMMSSHRSMRWGMSAPGALANAYKKFGDECMIVLPFEVTSAFSPQGMADLFKEEAVLPEESRVIHFWGSVHRNEVETISPEWIRKSNCPYAAVVKQVLHKGEWDFIPNHTFWKDNFQFGVRTGTWDIDIIRHVVPYYTSHGFTINEGEVVVDIGAHIGGFALYASEIANKVLAYEPSPENFAYLKVNIEMNDVNNVEACQIAVMDREGDFRLETIKSPNTGGCTITSENLPEPCDDRNDDYEAVVVRATTLDKVVSEVGKIGFLKMDCEGAEYPILLSTSLSTLRKIRVIAMETHNPALNEQLITWLREAGFSIHSHPEVIPECDSLGILYAARDSED